MTSIFDILGFKDKGLGVGPVQSVDEMTVIPLIGENRGDVASPQALKFERTSNYGSMMFSNDDSKPAIVPANYMIRGKDAQDHAMSGSGVVMGKTSQTFNNACCIEETQGGYLSEIDNDEDILPCELRKDLLAYGKRSEVHYGKLWASIKTWMRGLSLTRRRGDSAHLRDFYDDAEVHSALEDFAAEFEPVEGQVGAIIMINGTPIGLELMPTSDHWDAYWQQLIRGCYGAELVRMKMLGKVKPSTLILPDIPTSASPDEVKKILEGFVEHLQKEVIPIIKNIKIENTQAITMDGNLETHLLTTKSGGGDLILQDSEPIYLSLVL